MTNEWLLWSAIIAFLFIIPWVSPRLRFLLKSHRSISGIQLPFEGWWYVAVGGRVFPNHHIPAKAQQFAYDFCIAVTDSGKTYESDRNKLGNYRCFGQPILAAHAGTVVLSVDGIPDNPIGVLNSQMVYGNTVMIKHKDGPVSVYAHLRKGSVCVSENDIIAAGELLGRCGNSGNSSEPHLHFHIQSEVGFEAGVGIKPVFDSIQTKLSLREDAVSKRRAYTPSFPEFIAPSPKSEHQ